MTQLTPSQQQLLAGVPIGHMATADSRGVPHVIPVCFAAQGEAIYSALDQKPKRTSLFRLRRVRNIQENPHVSLVVDHYEDDWGNLWYILITGAAELLLEGAERVDAVSLLRQKYRQYREMDIKDNPVIKITPDRVVAWGTPPLQEGV